MTTLFSDTPIWPKNRDFGHFDPQKMGIFDQLPPGGTMDDATAVNVVPWVQNSRGLGKKNGYESHKIPGNGMG